MYLVFLILSSFLAALSYNKFKKIINPVALYIFTWNLMIGLFEMHLVRYNEVTVFTWITACIFEIVFSVCAILGAKCTLSNTIYRDEYQGLDILKKWIVILSAISALAVVPNFVRFIGRYGLNFMSSMSLVYQNRLDNARGYEVIPYLGTISYLALILSGVLFRRKGFDRIFVLPLVLTILDSLPSGGRAGFLIALLMFVSPILLYKRNKTDSKIILGIKGKIGLIIVLGSLLILFWRLSTIRSAWITENQFMTPIMAKLVRISPAIYKTYTYITLPFVTLSEYLKNPTYSFGINTFGMFINILNKLGMNLDYQRYQDVYYVPMACNVATYIRELVQDFSYVGAIIATGLFSFLYGLSYTETKLKKSIYAEGMSAIFSTVTIMSFFVFFYRESVFWFATIFMPIVIHFVYRKTHKIALIGC